MRRYCAVCIEQRLICYVCGAGISLKREGPHIPFELGEKSTQHK